MRCILSHRESIKIVFSAGGSAPDRVGEASFAGRAYDAPPDPLVGSPTPIPFSSQCLRRFGFRAFGASTFAPSAIGGQFVKSWRRHWQDVYLITYTLTVVTVVWGFYSIAATALVNSLDVRS